MLSSFDEFQVLLERYEADPGVCSKLLRAHSVTDPKFFVACAQRVILDRPVSRALKFITGLAIASGIIPVLLEVYTRDRPTALALARKIGECEPRFDTVLVEHLLRPSLGTSPGDGAFVCAALDLLGSVSEGDKLVPHVLKLLRNPDPKIRSKAALFIGTRTQNLTWATNRNQEFDGRVRANILESLFGLNSEIVHQLFRKHLDDENNRCRGNAVLGLYQLGDIASIPLVFEMAKHPEVAFRNTSAWLMARTGDPRFLPALAELMQDPDEVVRSQAFKGMAELKRTLRTAAHRPEFKAEIARVLQDGASVLLLATVHDAHGKPVHGLPGTNFVTKAGTPPRIVRQFSVEEYDCRSSLSVAFVLCLPATGEALAEGRYLEIVESCIPLRRSKDRWGILKLGHQLGPARAGAESADEPRIYRQKWSVLHVEDEAAASNEADTVFDPRFEYSAHQHRLRGMCGERTLYLASGSAEQEAKALIGHLMRVEIGSSKPHLIFLGADPPVALIADLAACTPDQAVFHFLLESTSDGLTQLRSLAQASGGAYRQNLGTELGLWGRTICSSLLHHYRITSSEIDPGLASPVEIEINAAGGHATAEYQPLALQLAS